VRLVTRPGGGAFVVALAVTALQVACLLQAPAARAASHGHRAPAAGPADVVAAAADLVDSTTGRRLWSRGLNHRRPIASITKVMTALVVIEAGHLGRHIRVTPSAVAYARENDAGSAGLVAGDVLTARQLLAALLLPSGADAAFALAHAYHRGWRAFVAKMNATARRLGMADTHFANFDGLPWPTEYTTYSTPRALLVLAAAAMKSAVFRAMVSRRRYEVGRTRRHHAYHWKTTNLLLGEYPGTIGIKTGFTFGAGYCLLFAARRHGQVLTGVVLDSTATNPADRFTSAARLLNWGFGKVRRGHS
jgi:serine-type D-Ala-D-Ala carboxypeptidase (penicillin-binding protein 5/6)